MNNKITIISVEKSGMDRQTDDLLISLKRYINYNGLMKVNWNGKRINAIIDLIHMFYMINETKDYIIKVNYSVPMEKRIEFYERLDNNIVIPFLRGYKMRKIIKK